MTPRRSGALTLAVVALVGGTARADEPPPGPEVAALALPGRGDGAAQLSARTRRIAERVAARLGGAPRRTLASADAAALDVTGLLIRARPLLASGALDDAADILDVALEAAARQPSLITDAPAFVSASLARAQIALARNEPARAGELVERLLRYDPSLALTVEEDSPRMRDLVDRVHVRVGARPALRPIDLGQDCRADGEVLIVARSSGDAAEFVRFDHCVPGRTVMAGPADAEDQIAVGLLTPREAGPGGPPPALRSLAIERVPAPAEDRPAYRKRWFWIAAAGMLGAGAFVLWRVERSSPDGTHVITHF